MNSISSSNGPVASSNDSMQKKQSASCKLAYALAVIALFAVAAWFRVVEIDSRLLHNDEGVNYHFIQQLRSKGYYPYSHLNYHGPSYFYMTAACLEFFPDDGELGMRSSAIVSGLLLIILLLGVSGVIGQRVALLGSILTACSASLVFYSRYAIHESLFLLTSAGVALSLYCWHRTRQERYIWLGWVSLALLIATKETFIISLFCIFWAFLALGEWRSILISLYRQRRALFLGSLVASLLVIVVFTGAFTWPGGIREMFLAVPQWVSRNASDKGHHKPFLYYLDMFWQSEPHLYLLGVPQLLQVRKLLLAADGIAWFSLLFMAGFCLSFARIRNAFVLPPEHRRAQFVIWISFVALCYCITLYIPEFYSREEQVVLQRGLLFFPTFLAISALFDKSKAEEIRPFLALAGCALLAFLLVSVQVLRTFEYFSLALLFLLLSIGYCVGVVIIRSRTIAVWCCSPQLGFIRFSAVWALLSLLVYSYVKYKTPWLIINITFPALLVLAGVLDKSLRGSLVQKRLVSAVATLIVSVSAYYCYVYNFVITDTQENDFYYVHTTPGMGELVDEIHAYWKQHPDARLLIGVPQYWPLPYYVRDHAKKVAYLKTNDFKQHSKKYDILILPKSPKTNPEGWLKRELRLSDVQETHTFFKVYSESPSDGG